MAILQTLNASKYGKSMCVRTKMSIFTCFGLCGLFLQLSAEVGVAPCLLHRGGRKVGSTCPPPPAVPNLGSPPVWQQHRRADDGPWGSRSWSREDLSRSRQTPSSFTRLWIQFISAELKEAGIMKQPRDPRTERAAVSAPRGAFDAS